MTYLNQKAYNNFLYDGKYVNLKKGDLIKYKYLFQAEWEHCILLNTQEDYNFGLILKVLIDNTVNFIPLNQIEIDFSNEHKSNDI